VTPVADSDSDALPSARPVRVRNHALWGGPLLVFAGAVSYFTVFARFPVLRDFPWLNLPLVLLGLAWSGLGVWRAYARRTRYRGRILGVASLGFSLLLAGLFNFYVFEYSYRMPEPGASTLAMDLAPDFELSDQDGRRVKLSDFRGRKVVLTFYRGFW
jgi:hypothetical protein